MESSKAAFLTYLYFQTPYGSIERGCEHAHESRKTAPPTNAQAGG